MHNRQHLVCGWLVLMGRSYTDTEIAKKVILGLRWQKDSFCRRFPKTCQR
jgi:hypothetical protein